MHELSIVEALVEQVAKEIDQSTHRGRVLRLEVNIGRLSGVNPDSFRFAFGLIAPGTLIENAELTIREPKARCNCSACQAKTEIDDLVLECPACSSHEIIIEGGRELILQSIELED